MLSFFFLRTLRPPIEKVWPPVMLIAFAFAVEATETMGKFVMAATLPAMNEAITSGIWGWL